MSSLGETLRQARLDKGVSLQEAEQETRIRRRYLEALENEDFAGLPAPVYARGIIRSYARYLGLAPESMVDLYHSTRPKEERLFIRSTTSYGQPQRQVSMRMVATILGVVFGTVLLFVAWGQYNSLAESIQQVQEREANRTLPPGLATPATSSPTAEPTRPVAAALPSPTPQPTATPTPAPPPVEGIQIDANVVASTLLEVWVDGQKVLAENVAAGTGKSFKADGSLRMRVSNGAAVEITENNVPRGPLDSTGRPVEAHWTRG